MTNLRHPLLQDLATQNGPDAQELARKRCYNRHYWQDYAKRHKRVFGTLDLEEYHQIKAIADQSHRAVWQQIWAESQAYRAGTTVPTQAIEDGQQALLIEMRRIGNNLNQLVRLGHIHARQAGGFTARGNDAIGVAVLRWCQALERQIRSAQK